MKILSRFKDYYDFVAGHDTDDRKVFTRVKKEYTTEEFKNLNIALSHPIVNIQNIVAHVSPDTAKQYNQIHLYFCDRVYGGIRFEVAPDEYEYYWSLKDIKDEKVRESIIEGEKITGWRLKWLYHDYHNKETLENRIFFRKDDTGVNKKIGHPILMIQSTVDTKSRYSNSVKYEYWADILLKDIEFNRALPPIETYQTLYNFIEYKEPELDSNPSNMVRFENKGFDKKKSFRNKK